MACVLPPPNPPLPGISVKAQLTVQRWQARYNVAVHNGPAALARFRKAYCHR